MKFEDNADCPTCLRPKKECECDPMAGLYEALDKMQETLRKTIDPNLQPWQCIFCKSTHGEDVECEEEKQAAERLAKKAQEHKRRSLEDPMEWPPKKRLVKEWTAHGLRCAIANTERAYCAYVHVPDGHPDEHKTGDELDADVNVHGGITFRQKSTGGGSWFGFDFSHGGDWVAMPPEIGDCPGRMWDVEDVVREAESLAKQLSDRAKVEA